MRTQTRSFSSVSSAGKQSFIAKQWQMTHLHRNSGKKKRRNGTLFLHLQKTESKEHTLIASNFFTDNNLNRSKNWSKNRSKSRGYYYPLHIIAIKRRLCIWLLVYFFFLLLLFCSKYKKRSINKKMRSFRSGIAFYNDFGWISFFFLLLFPHKCCFVRQCLVFVLFAWRKKKCCSFPANPFRWTRLSIEMTYKSNSIESFGFGTFFFLSLSLCVHMLANK